MMAFPYMLIPAAEQAGMSCPSDPGNFIAEEYPHFRIFCSVQLRRAMEENEPWDNAEVIAAIPEKELKTLTLEDLLEKGLRVLGH